MLKMDFPEMCVSFKNKLDELSMNDNGVNEIEIRAASKILRNFFNYPLQHEDLHNFLDSVVEYFELLIRFCKQFEDKPHRANFSVRMALNIFLFVVDTTNIYDKVFRKVVKIIIKFTEVCRSMTCIKEFLRMYVGVIKKISRSVILQLTNKNHNTLLTLLYSVVKNTNDVELQAVIIDIFLRYIRFNDTEITYYKTVFPEIGNLSLSFPITSSKSYQTTRMVLDKLNENSSKLFSINCSKIMLDHIAVTEFFGASDNDDVWLDIDMEQCRLTFFCDQTFLSSFTSMNFCNITEWEAVSFFTKDVVKANFEYSSFSESLEISMKIKTSSFNLFSNLKFDTIRYLLIKISKNVNKYSEFVALLPKLFPNFVSMEQLDTFNKVIDSSIVVSDDDSSSPVIEHFEISTKKKISTKNIYVEKNMETSFVISDSSSVVSISDSDDNERTTHVSFYERIEEQPKSKVSTMKEMSTFNKSITPISFTESVIGKNKPKISTLNKKNPLLTHSDETRTYTKKISTMKERERPKLKISTNLASMVVNKQFSSKPESVKNMKSPIVYMSERESSELASELIQDDALKYSTAKVKTWLKNLEDDNNNEETELERKKIIENDAAGDLSDEEIQDLRSVSSCSSNKNYSVEENLMKMFHSQGSTKSRNNEENIAEPTPNEENVLDILLTPVANENEDKKQSSFEKSEEMGQTSKNSDEIPLAQLALDLKKNEDNLETVRCEEIAKKSEVVLSGEKYYIFQIMDKLDDEETVLEDTNEEKSTEIQEEMKKRGKLEDQLNETVPSQIQDKLKENKAVSYHEDRKSLNETIRSQISQTKNSSKYESEMITNEELSGNSLNRMDKSRTSQIEDSSQIKNKMNKNEEIFSQDDRKALNQTKNSSKYKNKVITNEELSGNSLNRTDKLRGSQIEGFSQIKNKMKKNEEIFSQDDRKSLNETITSQISQTKNSSKYKNKVITNEELSGNSLNRTDKLRSSQIDDSSQIKNKMKKNEEFFSQDDRKSLNETVTSQTSQTKKTSKHKNEEFSRNSLNKTGKSRISQTDDSSEMKNKMKKDGEAFSQDNRKSLDETVTSQTKKASQHRKKVINEEFPENPLNKTIRSQSSQTEDSSQIKNKKMKSDETSEKQLNKTVTSQSSEAEKPSHIRDKMKKNEEISSVREDKPLNETITSQNTQTDISENRSQNISLLNISNDPAKKTKRKLYNPEDLSYLNTMITDDFFNMSKTLTNETINNNASRKTTAKKKERLPKSEEKKPPAETRTPKKRGRPSKSESLKCDFSSTNASKMSKPPVTELTFDKAFTKMKETVRKQKKEMKKKKKVEAVRRTKKRNAAAMEVSSPSTPPSLEPFGECMKSPGNKRKIPNIIRTSRKRVKMIEESDEDSGKEEPKEEKVVASKIKVISNILIKPASMTCKECLCTENFGKSVIMNFLQFFKHVEQYHPELTKIVECIEIYNILKRRYNEN